MSETSGHRDYLDGYADAHAELEHHVRRRAASVRGWDVLDAGHADRVRALVAAGISADLDAVRPTTTLLAAGPVAVAEGGVTVRRMVLRPEDRPPIPAVLYLPRGPGPVEGSGTPAPGVLFLPGHAHLGKDEPAFATVCAGLARAGCVVLAPDPWAQGERIGGDGSWGVEAHTVEGLRRWWGDRWLIAEMLLEARCALDVLEAMPEVDATRLGVTGVSGGGWMTTLVMAVDPRVDAAAVATFVTSRASYRTFAQAQDAEQHLAGAAELDHHDFLAVMAPRSVAVLAATWDFFPIEGAFDSVCRAAPAFDARGASDALRFRTAECGHGYTDPLREDAVEFFAEVFGLSRTERRLDRAVPPRVTAGVTTDGEPAVDDGRAVGGEPAADELRGERRLPEAGYRTMRPRGERWLRDRVFEGREVPELTRVRWLTQRDGVRGLFWRSGADLSCGGLIRTPGAGAPVLGEHPRDGVLGLVLTPNGTLDAGDASLAARLEALHPADAGPRVHLDLRGQGAFRAASGAITPGTSLGGIAAEPTYRLLCELIWLGDSLMAGRVHDLLQAIGVLLADPGVGEGRRLARTVRVLVRGDGPRLCAELAALLDPHVVVVPVDAAHGLDDLPDVLADAGAEWIQRWWEWVLPGWLATPGD